MYWFFYSSHTSHQPSQTPCLPWISYATQNLMLNSCKMVEKHSEAFHTFLWHFLQVSNRILLHIVLLKCQIAFRVYSNCCCSSSFEPEIIKIDQSSHKIYSYNILNFQESTTILNACTKKSGNILNATHAHTHTHTHTHIYIYMCILWVHEITQNLFYEGGHSTVILTESVFTKKEMNNQWSITFLQSTSVKINILIPASALLVEAFLKLKVLFVKPNWCISFDVLYTCKWKRCDQFSLYGARKNT